MSDDTFNALYAEFISDEQGLDLSSLNLSDDRSQHSEPGRNFFVDALSEFQQRLEITQGTVLSLDLHPCLKLINVTSSNRREFSPEGT